MNRRRIYLSLFILSASVLCFEIISTRISSVIFAYDYAFIILSLAILGLGAGGIFSYYFVRSADGPGIDKILSRTLLLTGASLVLFITAVTMASITNWFVFFFLLVIPFFLAGIAYAQIFKHFADLSFRLYAADLAGAAVGSLIPIGALNWFGAPNCVLLVAVFVLASSVMFSRVRFRRGIQTAFYSFLSVALLLVVLEGKSDILGHIPIGNFPEKDFYHVYPNVDTKATIIDSRWSIYGRSDLVSYSHQDVVRQLFIDGAAGTQMFRFNGDVRKPGKMLYDLLLSQTTTIPFLFLDEQQKNNMLVIGPGGGKEILMGLFGGVKKITGVEVNPDFVKIVRKFKSYDGGIYNDFPNVSILVKEGRSYVMQTQRRYDLVVMCLPSTEQLQNIDNLAMSENYLLTVDAIKNYLKVLTQSGELIFTVHNRLELLRLIITAMSAFHEMGISSTQALNHFVILEQEYAPTIVIKKEAFSPGDIERIERITKMIPDVFPKVTYLPGSSDAPSNSMINRFLTGLGARRVSLGEYISRSEFNVEPCRDDSPYFYKLKRQVSPRYAGLFGGVSAVNLAVLLIPFVMVKKKIKKSKMSAITLPLIIFASIGLGFMIIEVTLFQKMVLYLGAPTVSLSILLSSLLVGMGLGSFYGKKIFPGDIGRRLKVVCIGIVAGGALLFMIYPVVLNNFMESSIAVRALLSFLMIFPFGFLLGIPFPTAIQLLKRHNMEQYVPWMYGVNGTMSVLGSVAAIILSMQLGFTFAFMTGLVFYLVVILSTMASVPQV